MDGRVGTNQRQWVAWEHTSTTTYSSWLPWTPSDRALLLRHVRFLLLFLLTWYWLLAYWEDRIRPKRVVTQMEPAPFSTALPSSIHSQSPTSRSTSLRPPAANMSNLMEMYTTRNTNPVPSLSTSCAPFLCRAHGASLHVGRHVHQWKYATATYLAAKATGAQDNQTLCHRASWDFKKSAVFFQRTQRRRTPQTNEAVCTKRVAWHVITFGSHEAYFRDATALCRSVRDQVDSCRAFSAADLPASMRLLGTKGVGYWQWKPWLLLRELKKTPPGTVVAYMDWDLGTVDRHGLGTVEKGRSLAGLFCLGQRNKADISPFHSSCFKERVWTNRRTVEAMRATDEELDTLSMWAGLIVMRAEPTTISFLAEWDSKRDLFWEQRPKSDPNAHCYSSKDVEEYHEDAEFCDHRHDQAVFSIMTKRWGLKSFPIPVSTHDPRDIGGWEAGYCHPEFTWPLVGSGNYGTMYGMRRNAEEICRQSSRHWVASDADYFRASEEYATIAHRPSVL